MKFHNRLQTYYKPADDDGEDGGNDVTDATSGTIGTGNDDRLAIMAQIEENNLRADGEQLADVNDDGTTAPFVLDEPGNGDEEQVVKPADKIADTSNQEEVKVVETRPKIKVNGEEVELTPELIAKAQKIASADKYLEDARATPKRDVQAEPDTTPATPARDVEAERLEEERALVRAIQMGSEEEAIAALRKVRGSGQINTEAVARIADERLSFSKALDRFNNEFQDLVSDPQLHSIVLERDSALLAQGDKRSYWDRYEAIGKEVREWRDEMVKKFTPKVEPVADPLKAKQERKQSAPTVPKAANAKAPQAGTEDDEEEDTSSVIASMAKARGGPQWTRA